MSHATVGQKRKLCEKWEKTVGCYAIGRTEMCIVCGQWIDFTELPSPSISIGKLTQPTNE